MTKTKENAYFIVTDRNGDDFLCPLNAVKNRREVLGRELEECVEKDVVERYSGNIDIQD